MEPLRGKLLDGNRVPFDDIQAWSSITEKPGLQEWSGRFWLPAGGRVDPARKYCLLRSDGRAGEMTMERFKSRDAVGDVAIFQDNPDVA